MHLMIDLETLGTDPVTAPILQIAVVPFELNADGPWPDKDFQTFVTAASNEVAPFSRVASASTIKWWVDTNPKLLSEIMDPTHGVPLTTALNMLSRYVEGLGKQFVEGVWANGPTFDISMLNSAYQQAGMRAPWGFRTDRCVRTMAMLAGDDRACWEGGTKTARELDGAAHDARVDCDRQIRLVQQVMALKTHG